MSYPLSSQVLTQSMEFSRLWVSVSNTEKKQRVNLNDKKNQ